LIATEERPTPPNKNEKLLLFALRTERIDAIVVPGSISDKNRINNGAMFSPFDSLVWGKVDKFIGERIIRFLSRWRECKNLPSLKKILPTFNYIKAK